MSGGVWDSIHRVFHGNAVFAGWKLLDWLNECQVLRDAQPLNPSVMMKYNEEVAERSGTVEFTKVAKCKATVNKCGRTTTRLI